MVANSVLVPDGDVAFLRVNSRKPAHALQPGEVRAATNHRFDEGKPRPRFGVGLQRWGRCNVAGINLAIGLTWSSYAGGVLNSALITLETGKTYLLAIDGDADGIALGVGPPDPAAITYAQGVPFVYPGSVSVKLYRTTDDPADIHQPISAEVYEVVTGTAVAYGRFNDPNGVDNGVLLTDGWRTGAGEDGGRGRAFRIVPGNLPQAIPMNGHDIWGTCRLKQAHHTLVLARHGNERHYFSAAAVDATNNRIQLNCAPAWSDGDIVFLFDATGASQILSGPNFNAGYYIKTDASNRVTFYTNKADAIAGSNKIDFGAATGKFYLERREPNPGPFGIGAPTLILQPTDALTAFENGFRAAPAAVAVTDSDATYDTITAPSHRLQAGDAVTCTLSTDTAGAKFARPLSDHVLKLYDTAAHALAGGATGLFDVVTDDQTGTVVKTGAAALPMPPLRELCYYKGRIIGIVSGTKDTIVISDPFDFLHFSIFVGTVNANLGESGNANWLLPLGEDVLLIGKDLKILAITGLSGASSGWKMDDVTDEYGGIAALAALNVGTDGWCFTRKGVASIVRTVAGERLGKARSQSADIPDDLMDVDWLNAGIACSETWNGRYFIAVPVKGQVLADGAVRNNRVLVYNFFNERARVEQSVIENQIVGRVLDEGDGGAGTPAWEGRWEGDFLEPMAFCKLKVYGEERLTFATPDGLVCWFTDGFEDFNGAISTRLETRGYFGGALMLALKGQLSWDTFNPSPTVTAKTAGYKEEVAMTNDFGVDATKYLVAGQAAYDPATSTEDQFNAPHREDYATTAAELLVGELDVHQNLTENLRMRLRDRAPQLVIENNQGSVRINSVQLEAKPIGLRATRQS